MNKSRLTNLIALLIVIGGYFSPWYPKQIFTLGIFALSGALTNWIAVHMLFEKVPLLYGSGVIPAHFQEIKEWIKDLIMVQFFTEDNLEKYITQGQESIMEQIDIDSTLDSLNYDEAFDMIKQEILASKLGGMLAMFGGEGFLENYRPTFIGRIKEYLRNELTKPGFLSSLIGNSGVNIPRMIQEKVGEIVEQRLEELTPAMIKEIVQEMIQKHLGWLVVWGGVFGGLIGLVMSLVPGLQALV
ncbi:MAG: hypothetical protein JEY99_17545 [Spirochaetales bacterium]|nr:hypothetical protein [Spirochaetales bacterium]